MRIKELTCLVQRFCRGAVTWNVLRRSNMLPLLGVIITDGIEMNGKREYQRVGEGGSQRRSVEACAFCPRPFIHCRRSHDYCSSGMSLEGWSICTTRVWSTGVSRGCVSKPRSCHPAHNSPCSRANVLINHDDRACLVDFSLPVVTSDQSTVASSCIEGGTVQWMYS